MELRPQQAEVLTPLRRRYVHADPPGAGKTPVGLRWMAEAGAESSLVVAPKIVLEQWRDQALDWWPEARCFLATGAPGPRHAARMEFLAHSGPKMLVVNPESLIREKDEYLRLRFDTVLVDEAHMAKGRKTLTHKALVQIARRTPMLELATASPILNDAEESWSLLHMVDPKRWSSFWRWAHEHFWIEAKHYQGRHAQAIAEVGDAKPGHVELMAAEVADFLVMRDEDYVLPDLAKLDVETIEVHLTPDERRAYDGMLHHSYFSLDGKQVWAPNEVSKMTRLRQLASDWSALQPGIDYGSKVAAASARSASLVTQERKVLILAGYVSTVDAIRDCLNDDGIASVRYTGSDNEKQRAWAKSAFVDGEWMVMVGTLGALRVGLDGLQHVCSDVILVDREWTPELNRQAIGRLRRYGQVRQTVTVHNIVAADTIDATIADALERKQSVVNAITGRTAADVLHMKGGG